MSPDRRAAVAVGAVVVAGAAGAVRAATVGPPSGVIDALGRFHPAIVHFPVALILTAVVAESLCVARRDARFGEAARFMLTAAAWVSIAAAAAGFARADSITFSPDQATAFAIHRIAGVATPVLAFLASGLAEGVRRSGQIWELFLFRLVLLLAAAGAAAAAFYGGELVYGVGFFPRW